MPEQVSHRIDAAWVSWFALGSIGLTVIVALCNPLVAAATTPTVSAAPAKLSVLAWIATQSIGLVGAGWLIARLGVRLRNRPVLSIGCALMIVVPTVMLFDAVVYGWIRERFLSSAMYRVAIELSNTLVPHAQRRTLIAGGGLFAGWIALVALLLFGSRAVAQKARIRIDHWLLMVTVICLVTATPAIWNHDQTFAEMRRNSQRHPLCAFRIVSTLGAGPREAIDERRAESRSDDTHIDSAPHLRDAIDRRRNEQRRLRVVDSQSKDASVKNRRDVVIIVVESMRHELVDAEVMPNLWRYAVRGTRCRHHFSGGNATNHGIFSLVNGLEAIWYDSDVRYTPLMNRLMHQAGYEIGFFAGHNDWRLFRMDGFISPKHYDVFEVSDPDGLRSDELATRRAANFLNRLDLRGVDRSHPPRLALLYLYATHADFQSYAEDQVFRPAADDRFTIPFTQRAKPKVWNRYRNSARTIDRFLAAVMREDRVVIVTGDHGESFLEDGVCGHGVRISRYQNMTPAVIYFPGQQPRLIDLPTMHADLLPTLIASLEISTNASHVLDGLDLTKASSQQLESRSFVTRNYLNNDLAVIGSWTMRGDRPFGFRGVFSLRDASEWFLNEIDDQGQQVRGDPDRSAALWKKWLDRRFGQIEI